MYTKLQVSCIMLSISICMAFKCLSKPVSAKSSIESLQKTLSNVLACVPFEPVHQVGRCNPYGFRLLLSVLDYPRAGIPAASLKASSIPEERWLPFVLACLCSTSRNQGMIFGHYATILLFSFCSPCAAVLTAATRWLVPWAVVLHVIDEPQGVESPHTSDGHRLRNASGGWSGKCRNRQALS